MTPRRIAILIVAASFTPLAAQGGVDPQPIQRMAATERAFAAAALEIGARDAFLTFFAAGAIEVRPGPTGAATRIGPARPSIEAWPRANLPLASQLMWAPFTGPISADGTLGWLTGASVNLTLPTKTIASKGAYFSVWQREADGTWRVWLDEGVQLPQVWQDAAPFRAAPDPDAGTAGTPNETIEAAEHAAADWGIGWHDRLAAEVRLHRQGEMPLTGRDAAAAWRTHAWTAAHATVVTTRVAGSDDLGIAIGGYDGTTTAGSPEHGTWVRVWKRDVTARWRIVFEDSKPR
jgi:hypothetical protein